MIVFDENMRQRNIMDAVAAWYRGRVISVTVLRRGTIILILTEFVVTVSGLPERKQSRGYATSWDDTASC